MSIPEQIVMCPSCKGDGVLVAPSAPAGLRVCSRCNGEGRLARGQEAAPAPRRAELEPHELAPWSPHYAPRSS